MNTAIAEGVGEVRPLEELPGTGALALTVVACLTVAVALGILVTVLSTPRRTGARPRRRGPRMAHGKTGTADVWRQRIRDIAERHRRGALPKDRAFAELAQLCRDCVSSASGHSMASSTLSDLNATERTERNRQGLDLLRQTIEALYPPEFADARTNAPARNTDVEEACQWVLRLVERWRR